LYITIVAPFFILLKKGRIYVDLNNDLTAQKNSDTIVKKEGVLSLVESKLFVLFTIGWIIFIATMLALVVKSSITTKLKLFIVGWFVSITVAVMFVVKSCRTGMELKLFIVGCILFVTAMVLLAIKKYFKTQKSQRNFKTIYSWFDMLWSSIIIASFIMFFFVQSFKIPSGSMRETLLEGDHLFVNKFIYGFKIPFAESDKRYLALRNIKRGDIVVFQAPPEALTGFEREQGITKDFIKRCVAVAGDRLEIIDKKLYINGVCNKEPYAVFKDDAVLKKSFDLLISNENYQESWKKGNFAQISETLIRDNFGPVIVPDGHYMMMGDNRDLSSDSRFWGPLPGKYIKGKALFLYWPIKRWRLI
jgi:signal peptidase I